MRNYIDRLNVSRKEGGSELASNENCVEVSIKGLDEYIKSKDRLSKAANCSSGNISTDGKATKARKRKSEKNDCRVISSNKLARLHT